MVIATVRGFDLILVGCKYANRFRVFSAMHGCKLSLMGCCGVFEMYFVIVLTWFGVQVDEVWRSAARRCNLCQTQ